MADISFTATAIKATSTTLLVYGKAGETVTAGMALYLKTTDNEYYKADCTTSATTAAVVGIAMNGASNGQEVTIATGGNITCDGLSLSVATADPVIVLSEAGGVCPSSDLAASDYITLIGVPTSATNLRLAIKASGVAATA